MQLRIVIYLLHCETCFHTTIHYRIPPRKDARCRFTQSIRELGRMQIELGFESEVEFLRSFQNSIIDLWYNFCVKNGRRRLSSIVTFGHPLSRLVTPSHHPLSRLVTRRWRVVVVLFAVKFAFVVKSICSKIRVCSKIQFIIGNQNSRV